MQLTVTISVGAWSAQSLCMVSWRCVTLNKHIQNYQKYGLLVFIHVDLCLCTGVVGGVFMILVADEFLESRLGQELYGSGV